MCARIQYINTYTRYTWPTSLLSGRHSPHLSFTISVSNYPCNYSINWLGGVHFKINPSDSAQFPQANHVVVANIACPLCCCQLWLQLKINATLFCPSLLQSASFTLLIHHQVTATFFTTSLSRVNSARYQHHQPLLILTQDGVQSAENLYFSNVMQM